MINKKRYILYLNCLVALSLLFVPAQPAAQIESTQTRVVKDQVLTSTHLPSIRNEAIRFQRFVRLVDEAKRNEIILIYVEDAGTLSGPEKLGKDFLARALKGFTILK